MTKTDTVIAPGASIGILGGGQLGRMLAMAAASLGYKCHIYEPQAECPAKEVADRFTCAAYEDEAALDAFAKSVDVITYEFENVPAATAQFLAARKPVRPGVESLAASQDRLVEKRFLQSLGLPTAPFLPVEDGGSLARAVAQLGRPAILKSRRNGYDGKGQATIREGSDVGAVFRSLGFPSSIVEGKVNFVREASVIAARGLDGSFAAYDLCENRHENHILAKTLVPAQAAPETAAQAIEMTRVLTDALSYIGVIGVEFFITLEKGSDGHMEERLCVNEFAPRVHNSGHWTLDGATTSQFEQHIRAICGLPLGATTRLGDIVMENLIGHEVDGWESILSNPEARLHLYGKGEARPGRKMGHVTYVHPKPCA